MEKRLVIALILTALVVIIGQLFSPVQSTQKPTAQTRGDSDKNSSSRSDSALRILRADTLPERSLPTSSTELSFVEEQLFTVTTPRAVYRFSSRGAVIRDIELKNYRSLTVGRLKPLQLVRRGENLLSYHFEKGLAGKDLDQLLFSMDTSELHNGQGTLFFRSKLGIGANIVVSYVFSADEYLIQVHSTVTGLIPSIKSIVVTLPNGLRSEEADSGDDQQHLAYVLKPEHDEPRSIAFGKLDPNQRQAEHGPFTWIASKNKYFVVALLASASNGLFGDVLLTGGPRTSKAATNARADILLTLHGDTTRTFAFRLYTGPQEWQRLHAIGEGLENANPYGGFLRVIVQPFSTIVMRVLLWMHERLALSYGWVLVIFGIVVRLILWPVNQSAMRSSLKMQLLQPELAAAQKKYKTNPEKQQAEMMRIYREHNMSPFSTLTGCLPALLPMPVFIALFFVFQNTIEFRGVPFLWLSDISLRDPYFIIPILMGSSMFILSWIGIRNTPPNPQSKMMAYILPVTMTVVFVNFASGLNLYYTVQNIAALPQQWLIARERARGASRSG